MKFIQVMVLAFLLVLGSCHPVYAENITTETRCIDGKLFVIAYASHTQASGVGIAQVFKKAMVYGGSSSAPVECKRRRNNGKRIHRRR